MKKLFMILVSAITFVACGSYGPTAAEEPHLKSFIFRNSIDYDWKKSLKDDFIGDIYLGNIAVEGLDIPLVDEDQPHSFAEAVLIIFEGKVDISGEGEKKFKEDLMQSLDYTLEATWVPSWVEESYKKSLKLCRKNPQQAKVLYGRLLTAFLRYLQDEADKQVKMISWEYDPVNTGDSYTAYDVVYQLGTGFYILVNLVEFDDSERYEYKIINKANSLTEINDPF